MNNIFANIPTELPEELFTSLLKRDNVHIERIVSQGHSTPIEQWYDQAWDEWVLVLEGHAVLVYEQNLQKLSMVAGDSVFIPAHTKHRVEWTVPDIQTIWLAVHLYH
ncbi:MAG: cupin domain-containing protein [Methylococcales bacterium]|nr:cupin domain-containing protein [Methylococcales bacterium]